MRTWRVGTFSMGMSLILLGLFLLFSRMLGIDLMNIMTAWWPIILVVLGIEMLIAQLLAKQEKPFLKYDFISILFVGILGTVGIAFAIANTTGLMGKIEEIVSREERSFELPDFTYRTNDSIKRVVVRAVGYPMTIEGTKEKEVSMFGTYRVQTSKKEKQQIKKVNDYIVAEQKGDTLYINMKMMPNEVGPFSSNEEINGTILIPTNVALEVMGNGNSISLKPRSLESNWNIENASSVLMNVAKNSNLKIEAVGVQEVIGKDGLWKVTGKPEESSKKNAVYQSGVGEYHINIANTYSVSLNSLQ